MGSSLGLRRGTVRLTKYHPSWRKKFIKERERLTGALGLLAKKIEHVGSTAIPGMIAKPILDIEIGVPNVGRIASLKKRLLRLGYIGPRTRNRSNIVFVKGPESRRTVYVHVVKYGGNVWRRDIAFREWLRSRPADAQRYKRLKQLLAKKFSLNRERYTKAKDQFIRSILKKAT